MSKHSIIHIELPANSPQDAGQFYSDLFGWKSDTDASLGYTQFTPEEGVGGGFNKVGDGSDNGGLPVRPGDVFLYVSTDDIEGSLAKAESLGGTVIKPKSEIPGMGWYGIFADPTGNRVGLYTGRGA
jgi:uncharacterized protein